MQTIHIFFPFYDKSIVQSEQQQRVQNAVQSAAGHAALLEDGSILGGCLAGSTFFNTPAQVLSIETEDGPDAVEARLLRPLCQRLSREFSRSTAVGRFSIGRKVLGNKSSVQPIVYCLS